MGKLGVIVVAALTAASCAVLAQSAAAAGVVNGDFETGNLEGWTTHYSNSSDGEWFAYPKEEGQGIFTPPSGNWAAGDEEGGPDTMILYQDIAIPPYATSKLALTLFYESEAPIVVPTPNTLVTPGGSLENQQLRVDVIKPTAPIETVAPEDILATLFANRTGDPTKMGPTQVSADLSALAGQTVRLRIANAVNDNFFSAGIDAVSLSSTPINTFTLGALIKNRQTGGATISITVPGPGTVSLVSIGTSVIQGTTASPTVPGAVQLTLSPTAAGRKALKKKGKLGFTVELTYTPTGGTATTQTLSGNLNLKLKRHHRRHHHHHPASHRQRLDAG